MQWNPAGSQSRPAKLANSRKRVLRGPGVIPPAKRRQLVNGLCDWASKELLWREPTLWRLRKAALVGLYWPGPSGPVGVGAQGTFTPGFPRNLGSPVVSTFRAGKGQPAITENPRPIARVTRGVGSGYRPDTNDSVADVVSPSEGNEVRRDGRRGLGASHSTCEAGEFHPWETLWRKGDAGSTNRWRETWQVHRYLVPCQRNDNG